MTHGVIVSGVVLSPVSLAVTEEHLIIGIQGLCLFVLKVFVLRLPHTSQFFVGRQKIFTCRLVCGEFRQICDKIKACRAISDSARSQNVLSGIVG